jgi:Asp-tRNA(Asn)/Glu-tRNA(Gln) amidotransferase A subunit family amidase
MTVETKFHLMEATLADVQAAFEAGELSSKELVELYLRRIDAYDRVEGGINSIITVNPSALEDAARMDALRASGTVLGPLHGVPIVLKDQMDAAGMPTTMGSVLFKDFYPDSDATVTAKVKAAGAVVLAKVSLGEMGGGDTHGTLFGSTRNPYDLLRTVGGSSGGSAAAVSANLATIGIGQEGFASIRRPSSWNGIVGMRPTPGIVSRAGVYGGWPGRTGSLGPMARTVTDLATLLDVMAGYDPEDPQTAHGVGHIPEAYTASLMRDGLKGARIGVLRQVIGTASDPASEDFKKVSAAYEKALAELAGEGAILVDIEIPDIMELLATRTGDGSDTSFANWGARSKNFPFASQAELQAHPLYPTIRPGRSPASSTVIRTFDPMKHYEYLKARETLETNVLKVMADNALDAIVHKTVEHQPTLISEGLGPPYYNMRGAPHLNTFLVYAASMSIPAGFTTDDLPFGITLFSRAYSEPTLLKFAYAYEQATMHRRPPAGMPPLAGEP